jgi:hypothetical protein
MQNQPKFALLVAETANQQQENNEEVLSVNSGKSLKTRTSTRMNLDTDQLIEDFAVDEGEEDETLNEIVLQRQASTISTLIRKPQKQLIDSDSTIPKASRLIQTEHIQTGNVKKDVYLSYMKAATFTLSSSFVLFYIGYALLQLGRNVWLSAWADSWKGNCVNFEETPCADGKHQEPKQSIHSHNNLSVTKTQQQLTKLDYLYWTFLG